MECGIKSQVVSLLKRRGWDLGKDELVSNSDELSRKALQLEKKLEIATKALKEYADYGNWWGCLNEDDDIVEEGMFRERGYELANTALKEMEGVK